MSPSCLKIGFAQQESILAVKDNPGAKFFLIGFLKQESFSAAAVKGHMVAEYFNLQSKKRFLL